MNYDVTQEQTSRYGLVFAANLVSDQAKSLSDAAFRLWIILHTYSPSNPGDGWTVGAERLAQDAGFSRSTFFRALAQLKDNELVKVENSTASGKPNRYILVNAVGVRTVLGGEERGVNNDSPGFDYSHSCDTGEGHLGDTHTGAFTGGTNSNNPPNPPEGEIGTKLQGFIGRLLDNLYRKLEEAPIDFQRDFLLGDLAQYTDEDSFNLKDSFKNQCSKETAMQWLDIQGEILGLAPPESGRKRTQEKRIAFLTEAREAIQEYGRQL